MYTEASNFVEGVDFAYKLIFGICFFFFISITGIMIYIIIRYRKSKHPKAEQIKTNNTLEVTWTIIPLILVLIMFYYGYIAFLPMRHAPKDAMVVKTTGQMWSWDFEYSNGKHSPILVVPLGKAVKLDMNSKDVIHGMEIPQFRLKEDVIPGRKTMLWFIANHTGEYRIFCSYYCGVAHSNMLSMVKVVPVDSFNLWLNMEAPKMISADDGLKILTQNACTACHSLDGSPLVGPTLKGLFGAKLTVITDGKDREVIADTAYLRISITDPDKDIVKGFTKGLMMSYRASLKDSDINSIIEYLKVIGK